MTTLAFALLVVGLLVGAASGRWWAFRRAAEAERTSRKAAVASVEEACAVTVADLQKKLEQQVLSSTAELEAAEARTYEQSRALEEQLKTATQGAEALKVRTLDACDRLGSTIDRLLGVIETFERWNEELNQLLQHNREMHSKNDEFAQIVNQVIIVALNASIEAARAGE